MKKIFLLVAVAASVIFFSCKKEDAEKAENLCPVVAASAVPQIVKDSFALRYPATNVITWFNKDSVAFSAYFISSANVQKLAQFANNGIFMKEELETQQEGEYQDTTVSGSKLGAGCKCETRKEGD